MDLFIDFVLSFAGLFILSHFLYSISGRRRKIPIIVLTILFVSALVNFFLVLGSGFTTKQILLHFMSTVMPILVAYYFFMVFTGGIPFLKLKFRRKSIKGVSSDIQTKKLLNITSYVMISVSIVMGVLAGFFKPIFLPLFILILGIGIYILIRNNKIKSESVILFVGRNKERIYEYPISADKTKVLITDFFTNDLYIVDPIGLAILINSERQIEKHYLYWIATGDQISTKGMPLKQVSILPYQEFINHYEKYHYRQLEFNIGKTGHAELIKEKVIK